MQLIRKFIVKGLKMSQSAMSIDIRDMRKPYKSEKEIFLEKDLVSNEPFGQFKSWFEEALSTDTIFEPNAMTLATSTKEGIPSCRVVLLKGFGTDGFKFYSNYESRKGKELEENPFASLSFYWGPISKCVSEAVRIEGKVYKLSLEESTEYFNSRPKASQIGALVSNQSQVIESRDVLTEKNDLLIKKYEEENSTIPKPKYWGGYRVVPHAVEFWLGHSNRLHDRVRYTRPMASGEDGSKVESNWKCERLAP